jgi:hypothetical protein
MARRKKHKPRSKCSFIQDWGTYSNQTFVCVGLSFDEITRRLKQFGKAATIDWLNEETTTRERMKCASAFVWFKDGRSVLWLKAWANAWEHFDTLNHETVHLIDFVLTSKGMQDEMEGRAYQHEFLFREIRRALFKRLP